MLDHLLGRGEVGDHAVAQRLDGLDLARRAAEHGLGLAANGDDLALAVARLRDGDDGRLIENDPPSRHVNQSVGRAKVDGHVLRDKAQDLREHTPPQFGSPRREALNATEIRERQNAAAAWPSAERICMLRQILVAGNASGGRFEKTIRLPEPSATRPRRVPLRHASFATICGPLKAAFKHLTQYGGAPSDFVGGAPKNKAAGSTPAASISGRSLESHALRLPLLRHEASIVSGFRLPSRASSLFSALT